MQQLVLIGVLAFMMVSQSAIALGLADFVPDFIVPERSKGNLQKAPATPPPPPMPLVKANRGVNSKTKPWYCNRIQSGVGNVFCETESRAVARVIHFDNTVPNIPQTYNSQDSAEYSRSDLNQGSSQGHDTLNNNSIRNNFAVPISPSDKVKLNVAPQQLEINIKY